jgi:glycosyltransferase involved in cell wall biosynthesis
LSAPSRVALAHHWLVSMRGGEKVLEQISQLFPDAPIYTLVALAERLSPQLQQHPIRTSWLQTFGGVRTYKKLLPFFPSAIRSLRVEPPVDLVLSSDASVIKGLTVPDGTPHICYCHSPPRYLWDLQDDYLKSAEIGGALGRAVFSRVTPGLREFDRRAASRVTHFVASSLFVQERIRAYYGRESSVIYPPVAIDDFMPAEGAPEDFYLIVSQLAPYKRIDVAVEAFNRLGRRLIVIGEGSEHAHLASSAKANITFLGPQPFSVLQDHFRRCRALIFPGVEDFGITPLEAQACGRPVLAFGLGGVLETVLEGITGTFFFEQTPDSLIDGIARLEANMDRFDVAAARRQAERFSPARFRRELISLLRQVVPQVVTGNDDEREPVKTAS